MIQFKPGKQIFYFMNLSILSVYMSYTTCMPSAWKGQKAPDHLELELWTPTSVGARNWTWVIWKNSHLLTTVHLSTLWFSFFLLEILFIVRVCVCVHDLGHTCGGQDTFVELVPLLPPWWALGIRLWSSATLSHLPSPVFFRAGRTCRCLLSLSTLPAAPVSLCPLYWMV